MATTMKAVITGENHTVGVQDVPIPTPSEGQILVKVHYVAQNPTDWKGVQFFGPGRMVGCDFSGTVANPNGSSWKEGQRVGGWVPGVAMREDNGAYAEYLVADKDLVFAVPDSISFPEAAVVSLAFATAVQAFYQRMSLPEPSSPATTAFPILINGGTSSVGMYAVQLAKLTGLFVVATASPRHHELLKSYGADAVVDYHDADWVDQVKKLTNDGLEHALDCVSEDATIKFVAAAMSSTKGGHLLCILPHSSSELPPESSKVKVESTIAYTVFGDPIEAGPYDNYGGPTPKDKEFWAKYLTILPELLASGKIKPNPPKEFGGLEDIPKGFEFHAQGKVSAQKLVYKVAE